MSLRRPDPAERIVSSVSICDERGTRAPSSALKSIAFAPGRPRGENRHVGRVESHQISAIARGKPAEHLPQTEERRRMRRRKPQRVRQRNSEQANAIGDRARHVEHRPGERPIVPDAAAVAVNGGNKNVTLTGSFAEQKRALLSLLQNAPLTA